MHCSIYHISCILIERAEVVTLAVSRFVLKHTLA